MGRLTSTSRGRLTKSTQDLNSIEGLTSYAQKVGLGQEANQIVNSKPKLSFLQRLGSALGAFNPAEAILTGKEQGLATGIKTYGTGILRSLGSAVTGTDYNPNRRTFSDVASEMGVKNGIAKFGVGFLGDVLLDPTTYFGGAIAKGVLKTAGISSELALKGIGTLAPETETGLRLAGTGLQDAFGRAFVSGYKSSKGATADVMTAMNVKATKLAQEASDQLSNLGVGGLSKAQRLEVGLKTAIGKQGEFLLGQEVGERSVATGLIEEAQRTGNWSKIDAINPELKGKINVKFDTPQQVEYFAKQQIKSKEFANMVGVQDPYAVYMPFLKDEVKTKFLKDIQGKGITIGSKDYLKEFKNIVTTENMILDPAKAHFIRNAQIISDTENATALKQFVEKYGKPIDSFADESIARQAGFRALKEKGGLGKIVGYVGEWDAKLFNDLIRPEFQTINMLAKATGFDAVTNLFKRSVTGLFLPFYVRNYASGLIQNFETFGLDAFNPKTIAAGQRFAYLLAAGKKPAEGLVEVAGKPTVMKDVFQSFADRFAGDTFFTNEFLNAADTGTTLKSAQGILSKGALRSTLGFEKGNVIPLIGAQGSLFKSARVVGQFIEYQQKAVAYLTALGQGKAIPEALQLAERAGFDYRALTQFESQIMKRIIPFYSFTRKNVELQLRTLGENPQRINQILSFFSNMGDRPTETEKKSLPEYLQNSIGIKLADLPNGIKQYISSFGTPVEQFANLVNGNPILQTISTMNPLLKVPIELGIGKDSFRQKDLKDVYDASEYGSMPKIIQNMLDIMPVQKDILEKQPNGKLKKIGERTQYIADPVKLLIARSLFTSRGVTYLDQVFGGKLEGLVKLLKVTTGIKPVPIDLQMQQSLNESKQKQELTSLLTKKGGLLKYQNVYKPK